MALQRERIFLDYAATSPTDPRVVEAMLPYFTEHFGNPSSAYSLGTVADEAVTRAREAVAEVLGADRNEIVFTGGGSEAINLALKGVALARGGGHLVTTAIEHHATLHAAEHLARRGCEITVLPVGPGGRVAVDDVRAALRDDTALVSIMYANNEIGTVQPIAEIGALCRERGVPLHVDAVQAVGWLPLDVEAIGADLLSISGHKFGGPKGVGALFVRHGTPLAPLIDGGAQERRRRAGTENVPGVVGLATALRLAVDEADEAARHCRRLRDRLEGALVGAVPHTIVNGDLAHRLPNHLHVTFDGVEGDASTEGLVALLDAEGVCVASGSACNSRALEPSHVLRAIGRTPAQAFSSVRFTLGKATTDAEIDRVAAALPPLVGRLRRVSPAYQRLTNEER